MELIEQKFNSLDVRRWENTTDYARGKRYLNEVFSEG